MSNDVYIVGHAGAYGHMYQEQGWELVGSVVEADLVQFTGGEDVSPCLYGEINTKSYTNLKRDMAEIMVFEEALERGLPMVGICRGGQFLNVMSGGTMHQDVSSHAIAGTHKAYDTKTGECINVSSTHHQMMVGSLYAERVLSANPKEMNTVVWEKSYKEGKHKYDVEALYYQHTKCFCFQPHPEMQQGIECRPYFFNKIKELFNL